ncbi:MAG: helix-turn-helix transcriptional regulator [Ilumatobacteraceae bacterium]
MAEDPTSRRGPRPVNLRLRRLLVMLPWLAERGSVSTRDMADHFGLTVRELVSDLTLASMCGASQDPLDLIDLWVDEDEVHIGVSKYFERPLRLTVPEASTLVVSAALARQLPGSDTNDALARAVDKIAAVTGLEADRAVAVDIDAPSMLEPLARAIERSEEIEFGYWAVSSGELQQRRAVPVETFREQDHWYVRTFDVDIAAERTFRLDRMESPMPTGVVRSVGRTPRGPWFSDSEDAREVTLRIDPAWLWMLERYPLVQVEDDPGSADLSWRLVRMVVSNERWLGRLLLRLGSHAELVEPVAWRNLAQQSAGAVLRKYRQAQLA